MEVHSFADILVSSQRRERMDAAWPIDLKLAISFEKKHRNIYLFGPLSTAPQSFINVSLEESIKKSFDFGTTNYQLVALSYNVGIFLKPIWVG